MPEHPSENEFHAALAQYEQAKADSICWQNQWEEKSPEGIRPLTVNMQLATSLETKKLHTFTVKVTGIRHPYDSDGNYNYLGNSVMNPALIPARDLLNERLPRLVAEALSEENMTKAISKDTYHNLNSTAQTSKTMDGLNVVLHINPPTKTNQQEDFTPASDEQIYSFCDRLRSKIEALMPEVRETIATHKDKHPPMPPTRESELGFHASVEGSWTSAMASAKNEGPCELLRQDETPFRK